MEDRTKKERNIDKFIAYLKTNPNTNYTQAARVMHKTPRTIHNWCKERSIGLSTASAASRPSPSYNFTVPYTSVHPRAQSQSHSSSDDLDKIIDTFDKVEAFKDRVRKRVEDSRSAFGPGSSPRQAESAEEYEPRLKLQTVHVHQRTKDEMLRSVILPLGDYVAQLLIRFLGRGSK